MKIELYEIKIRDVVNGYVDSQENGVVGYGGKLNGHIAAFASSDHAFPMGDGKLFSRSQIQPRPYLRFTAKGEQRQDAAKKQQCRKSRNCNPGKRNILVRKF